MRALCMFIYNNNNKREQIYSKNITIIRLSSLTQNHHPCPASFTRCSLCCRICFAERIFDIFFLWSSCVVPYGWRHFLCCLLSLKYFAVFCCNILLRDFYSWYLRSHQKIFCLTFVDFYHSCWRRDVCGRCSFDWEIYSLVFIHFKLNPHWWLMQV